MYKIYFEKRFIFISSQPDRMQKYRLFYKYHDIDELYAKISAFIRNNEISSLNIYSYKINSLWNAFRAYFENRIASGGLLYNDNEELLFIRRRSKWDIPKGHLSENESVRDCAVREIEEETMLKTEQAKFLFYMDNLPDETTDLHFLTLFFECSCTGEVIINNESSEYRWIDRDDLKLLNLAFEHDEALRIYFEGF